MKNHLISVIVPCYNQAQYLDECLQSVLDQTYQHWECIVVNDGSPDHTEEIALQWTKKDNRFIYLKKENGGLSSARNAGIDKAKGEWIQFLDSDDRIEKEKFKISMSHSKENDLIITNYQLFSQQGLLPDYCNYIDEEINYRNVILKWDISYTIPIHCGIFKKDLIYRFNENLTAKEDWIFWIDYLKLKPRLLVLSERLAYYRVHHNNMTKDMNHMLSNELNAYRFIYERIDENLKSDFFYTRILYKNKKISYLEGQNKSLEKMYNSKYMRLRSTLFKYFNI